MSGVHLGLTGSVGDSVTSRGIGSIRGHWGHPGGVRGHQGSLSGIRELSGVHWGWQGV